jgi:hypothetical protein
VAAPATNHAPAVTAHAIAVAADDLFQDKQDSHACVDAGYGPDFTPS